MNKNTTVKALIYMLFSILIVFLSVNHLVYADEKQEAAVSTGMPEPFMNLAKLTVNPGKKIKLQVLMYNGKIKWSSKDESVATVDKRGQVTSVAAGTTYILAETSDKLMKCKIKVKPVSEIRICAVGDALLHENIMNFGKKSDGSYNYDELFKNMADTFRRFDVRIINQETVFINDESKFAGYPSFGSPKELGDSMRKYGFNVITCATNHAYDRGISGIKDTVDYWSDYSDNVLMTGIYTSQKSFNKLSIREYNGIKIAFLNYTTLLNSGAKRESYNIKMYSDSLVKKEIEAAKKKADFVIVLPHWGEEYVHEPSARQISSARIIAEAGADLIIGCHPHVVQPMKIIKTSDGRKVPCYYSLGNYFSNMFWFKCQLEGMVDVTIQKNTSGTKIIDASYIPIVNHMNPDDTKFTVYTLDDYSEELAKKHYMNYRICSGLVTKAKLKNLFSSIGNDSWK